MRTGDGRHLTGFRFVGNCVEVGISNPTELPTKLPTKRKGQSRALDPASANIAAFRGHVSHHARVTASTHCEEWLHAFARAVRDRDFERGRELFSKDVIGFGTVCCRADGLDRLASDQWNRIWPNTTGFDFAYDSIRTETEGRQAVIMATWSSTGIRADGSAFRREGRATIVLQHQATGWKAVHTHFSLTPDARHDTLLRAGT
jgi:ketosteroid isomerase-like protein